MWMDCESIIHLPAQRLFEHENPCGVVCNDL